MEEKHCPSPKQPAANVKNLPDQLLTIKASTMKVQYGEMPAYSAFSISLRTCGDVKQKLSKLHIVFMIMPSSLPFFGP